MELEAGLDEVQETFERLALHHRPTIGYSVYYIMDSTPQLSGVPEGSYSGARGGRKQVAPRGGTDPGIYPILRLAPSFV